MSQNSEHYQSVTSPSSASPRSRRRSSQQQFLTSSSDFNTPPATVQNDSSPPQPYTSPIVNDVCASSQNGVRNTSTTMKINNIISPNGNHFNDKYAFTLEFAPPVVKTRKDQHRNSKPQLLSFAMTANDEEDLHSPFELDVPLFENPSSKKVQNDFLIDRMFKDEMSSDYASQPQQQQRSPNQSSYINVLNHASPLLTSSSDQHDIDALSDAGTYIIEDDIDIARDDEPEQDVEQPEQNETPEQTSSSSTFKRYTKTRKNRQGTFDIHAIVSPSTAVAAAAAHAVNRPIVDLNIPTHDLSPSSSSSSANLSSSSSLLSLPTESDNSIRKEPEGASHYIIDDKSSTGLIYARQRPSSLTQQEQRSITPPQNQIKPSECFVISPVCETKPFPSTTNAAPRRKVDTSFKPKTTTSTVPAKDANLDMPSKKPPPSPPLSTRSNQSDTDQYSFCLQQQPRHQAPKQPPLSNDRSSLHTSDYVPSSSKSSVRSHIASNEQTHSSPFQRNTSIRQTMPPNTQYHRPLSSSTTSKHLDDSEEVLSSHPSLTKVYMNKSFALRRQRSNFVPATAKFVQQQPPPPPPQQTLSKPLLTRQLVKPTTSIPSTSVLTNSSGGQTNRAVELRRARAQAKIEELAQRTRQQLQKTEQHNDVMSASWHSNASSSSKKDFSQLRSNPRPNSNNNNQQQQRQERLSSQKQDLLKTRTIPSSSHHRSSSASPNPLGEPVVRTSKYRKTMASSVTDESQYSKMNGSTLSEGGRCGSLRDDGQRLAIKLIQLSSGILAKLKPATIANDDDSNVRELEQLVDQLQTVNRTLSNIDASLNDPTSDEPLL